MNELPFSYEETENFLEIVESGDCGRVQQLLDANSRWLDADDSIFHRVTTEAMTKLLLRYGVDPNAKGYDGMTPLHFAAYEDCPEIVPALIAAGAKLDAMDDRGCTPLTYSSRSPWGNEITQMLLEAGATYTITAAASLGDIEGIKRFLEKDPQAIEKVPAKDWLFTAVLVTANAPEELHVPITRLLLENYDWGKSFLTEESKSHYNFVMEENRAEFVALMLEYAEKSKKP